MYNTPSFFHCFKRLFLNKRFNKSDGEDHVIKLVILESSADFKIEIADYSAEDIITKIFGLLS